MKKNFISYITALFAISIVSFTTIACATGNLATEFGNDSLSLVGLTDSDTELERYQNNARGDGRLTNAQVKKQQEANEKAGLGYISNNAVERERKKNEEEGFGPFTNEQLEQQRIANEKAGLGKITNAEVETEQKKNEEKGLGRITNKQIYQELEANEKAFLGRLTNAEVETERQKNEKAGLGRFTNMELQAQEFIPFVERAKDYEQRKQWAFALNAYYDAMSLDCAPELKKEAVEGYRTLAKAIESGRPGLDTYDAFSLPEEWKKLLIEAEKVGVTKAKDIWVYDITRSELNYKNKTATYNFKIRIGRLRYDKTIDVISQGYKKARQQNWNDLPEDWPRYSVSTFASFNYPDDNKLDKNWTYINPGRKDFNSFAYSSFNRGIHELDLTLPLFEFDVAIFSKEGKQLTTPLKFICRYSNYSISDVPQEIMEKLDNGNAYFKITGLYLKCGYGEYKPVYSRFLNYGSVPRVWETIETNSLICNYEDTKDRGQFAKLSNSKVDKYIRNLKEIKIPFENPNATKNVEEALKRW